MISWKLVFNTSLVRYADITDAAAFAKSAGYKFFTWNGEVRFTHDQSIVGVTEEELI